MLFNFCPSNADWLNLTKKQKDQIEKDDHEETLAQTRYFLDQSVTEYINTFGDVSFAHALNMALAKVGLSADVKIGKKA